VHFVYMAIRRGAPEVVVLLVSGREERWRPETERWLRRHDIAYDALYLRPTGDHRRDTIVKREIYERHIARRYRVRVVFEDRDQTVRLWRDDLGLPCFQVAWGAF
ncbi:MAG: polynucleotide kinase, partial [Thermomicrobiales bacterium]|nr:polynucleotide kinase [Thermomicrobiales bacterium]